MSTNIQSWGQQMRFILNMGLWDVIDILIVATAAYAVINLIRRTRTYTVFQGVLILLFVLALSSVLELHTVNFILRNTMELGLLALVILFQPELRRFLEKLGNGSSLSSFFNPVNETPTENAIRETVLACSDLSASRTGALIIFERQNNLDEQIRTGTRVDAEASAELMKNIFFNKAPLHDGAVIMRSGRIHAAGCVLPLTANNNLSKDLGMRHRAGIGMSENSDALVVIVSEETGAISVAADGLLKRHLSPDTLEKLLRAELLTEENAKNAKNGKIGKIGFIRPVGKGYNDDERKVE